jgi:hypothetical protein
MAQHQKDGAKGRPRRLQLRRTKGWRMPANTRKVDRTTLFGNPFLAADHGPAGALALYRAWITGRRLNAGVRPQTRQQLARRRQDILRALPTLRGKNLACWCPLPTDGGFDTCHAALLLELANR